MQFRFNNHLGDGKIKFLTQPAKQYSLNQPG